MIEITNLLFTLDYEMEMYYVEFKKIKFIDNRFVVGRLFSDVVAYFHNFSQLKKIEFHQSVLSFSQLKRLIEICATLDEYDSNIRVGSEEHKTGLKLADEANKILSLLNSEENKRLKEQIEILKMKKMKNGLNRKEVIEFLEHIGRKTFDDEIILEVYENRKSFGETKFGLFYGSIGKSTFETLYGGKKEEIINGHFDYEKWINSFTEDNEGYFEASTGKIIEYDSIRLSRNS